MDKRGRLDLNGELSGIAADPVHRLVDTVVAKLETRTLSPLLDDILPHRDPDVRDVGASVHPGGRRVRRYRCICEEQAFEARGRVLIKSPDAKVCLALTKWTGVISAMKLVDNFFAGPDPCQRILH